MKPFLSTKSPERLLLSGKETEEGRSSSLHSSLAGRAVSGHCPAPWSWSSGPCRAGWAAAPDQHSPAQQHQHQHHQQHLKPVLLSRDKFGRLRLQVFLSVNLHRSAKALPMDLNTLKISIKIKKFKNWILNSTEFCSFYFIFIFWIIALTI